MRGTRALWAFAMWCLCPALGSAGDPLRIIPTDAEVVLKIEQPRKLLEAVLDKQLLNDLLKIEAVRDALDNTQYRRFDQLRTHFEKKLGHGYVDLIDKLGGGGVVVAARFSERPAVLAIVESTDAKLLRDAVELALDTLEQELARQEVRERPVRKKHGDIETIHFSKQLHLAAVGTTLLLANEPAGLHAAIDRALGKGKQTEPIAGIAEAKKSWPMSPLAWGWLSLEAVRKAPNVKTALEALEADPKNTILLGGLVDLFKKSSFLAVGLSGDTKGLELSARLPKGRDSLSDASTFLLPENGRGSLPLLEPANVLLSTSYFLDLGKFWDNRAKILNKEQLKVFEEVDAKSGLFLGGTKMSTLFHQGGPYQRIVIAQQPTACYKIEPKIKIPSFALVVQMRDPAFARSMETVLRAGGLLASTQFQLKMNEQKHAGTNVISYRFDESKKLGGDNAGLRFNFSPAFAKAGDQFILCSTEELCRELIDTCAKEKAPQYSPSTYVLQAYATGGAAVLRALEEQILSQAILAQGLSPDAAKEQLNAILAIVERLGSLRLEEHYGSSDFRYELRWLRR